jgi:LuxR family maltose regulon positive regulatory protein
MTTIGQARARPSALVVTQAGDPKVCAPRLRTRLVPRRRLLAPLVGAQTPLVSVVAPPGFGKTTLLAQWAEHDPRPHAWLTLDDLDNDATTLRGWFGTAIEQLPGAGPITGGRLTSRRLGQVLASIAQPVVLLLDDVHLLTELEAIDSVTDLLPYLPPGSCLALAGRSQPVRLGRLRVKVDVLELGPDDLALDEHETAALLEAAGVPAEPDAARSLWQATEGWAAITSLATSAGRQGHPVPQAAGADRRVIAEYLHSEVMSRIQPEVVEFMQRSSVLDELTGPLCDAVLQRVGSGEVLEALAAANMLVAPVGDTRDRYRYHPVLRDLLLTELDRKDPGRSTQLRQRAAEWLRDHGAPWQALRYAYDAGDLALAAHLAMGLAQPAWVRGQGATAERWMSRLERSGILAEHPEVAAVWATILTLEGRADEADQWIEYVGGRECRCVVPDRLGSYDGWRALALALRATEGPRGMRENARRASREFAPSLPISVTAHLLLGVADLLEADLTAAAHGLRAAAVQASRVQARHAEAVSLGYLGYLESVRDRWPQARDALEAALVVVEDNGFEAYPSTAIVYAAAARAAHHDGDTAQADRMLSRFTMLRPTLTHATPYLSVHARLAVAAVHRANGDTAQAAVLVSEMHAVLERSPGLPMLEREVALVLPTAGRPVGPGAPGSTLTTAELRLLPLLTTHLSFRGIGERLFLSPHTIKTQALSIYRKLAVTSRDQAVTRARELGLIDD